MDAAARATDGDHHLDPLVEGEVWVYDGVAAQALGDTLLVLWRAPARRARVRRVARWAEATIARAGGDIAACQLLLPSASPPDRAARAEALRGYRRVVPHARCLITVPMGDRVWHELVRRIVRLALAVIGKGHLVKVASDVEQALALLQQVSTERSPGRAQLERAVDALYAALDVERVGSGTERLT